VHLRLRCAAAALLAACGASAADPIPPLGIPDLTGPRTLALSAGIGLASGNEGLFLNPGALAARRRYAADGLLLIDRRPDTPGDVNGRYFGGTVADSVSAPVALAVSYLRANEGPSEGNLWQLAFASPLTDRLFLGLTGKYYTLSGVEDVRAGTLDAGLFWQVTEKLSLGGVGYNLIPTNHEAILPRAFGAGLTIGSESSMQLTGDWRIDLERADEESKNRYGVGAEYLLRGMFPVRAGYQVDEVLDTTWWSAGLGIVTPQVALDLAFRQSVDVASARTFSLALRGFFPTEM
jgi:hypothetical protein